MDYLETQILENKRVSACMNLIKVEKPQGFTHSNGQYLECCLSAETSKAFFAIANPPEKNYIEFIIKNHGEVAHELCASGPGKKLFISNSMGQGFPNEPLHGKTVYLISHGSGFSAIKPVVEEIRAHRELFGPVRFIYGASTPENIPMKSTITDWMGSIEVYDIVSKSEKSLWKGEFGRVQDVLLKIKPSPDNSIALVVGSKQMIESITEILKSFGFANDQMLLNT